MKKKHKGRKNYGYFNQPVAPAPPEALPRPTPAIQKPKGFGMRRDINFIRQVVGGMIGFAGTQTVSSILSDQLAMGTFTARLTSGAVVYAASWIWSYVSKDMDAKKAQTRNAILIGVIINVALYALTEGLDKAKSAIGLAGYSIPTATQTLATTSPTPQTLEGTREYGAMDYVYQ